MTECNQSSFGFEACGSREIVARFDGGTISSDGGAFLLRQTDKRLNLLPRLAECFLDGRNQEQVEHSILEMLSQREPTALGAERGPTWAAGFRGDLRAGDQFVQSRSGFGSIGLLRPVHAGRDDQNAVFRGAIAG